MRNEKTTLTPAQECEQFVPFFIENQDARECRETLLHFLSGGTMDELQAKQLQGVAWMISLMNNIADVQMDKQNISCTLKIA